MLTQPQAGEAALVRAVRALDHGDAETIPGRLERVWDILEDYRGGRFHAAEEMLLRWLLKNMTGSSSTAERLRRYPRVWQILAAVFSLIPLFSLAKSLADRRFVALLQQTLKDIAAPEEGEETGVNGADSDVDMVDAPSPESPANPRKRKRPDTAGFCAGSQRILAGCLRTAEAVFDAVRTLLSRCELSSLDGPATHRMGAEHVKSLFSTSASDAMGILVPWLTICGFVVDKPKVEQLREQSSWLTTFAALWELRLQSAADASEVAIHLSGTAARILGKLTGQGTYMPPRVGAAVQERWAQDLRRFLTRVLILPARGIFLTKGGQEIVKIAVDMSSPAAHLSFPVLFDLVSKTPTEHGAKTSRKDHDTWVQTVFDAILYATKNVNRENRTVAVRGVMELAAERGAPLSVSSLRVVCNDYALRKDGHDWILLLAVIKLNPDVFLVGDEGKKLLERVLEKTREPCSIEPEEWKRAARFLVLLADGFAQTRDLSTFVRIWLEHLAPSQPGGAIHTLWAQDELADAVAKLVQPSLNSSQLIEIIEWLASRTQPNNTWARVHILEALSNGVSQEELVDTVNIKIFEATFAEKPPKSDLPSISALRWTVASKAIIRGTVKEASQIWSQIKSDVKSTLRKGHIDMPNTFTAFKCCVALWSANYPGGPHEDDAAKLICSFVEQLQKIDGLAILGSDDPKRPITKGTYFRWILSDAPRGMSFSHLESIGRCLMKVHKRSNRRSRDSLPVDDGLRDRGNLKLLQQLTVLAIRQMTSGSPEEREKTYLRDAISLLQRPCDDSDAAARILFLQAFISTVRYSPAIKKLEEDGLNLSSLEDRLIQVASPAVTSGKRNGKGLLVLLIALEALSDVDNRAVRLAFSCAVPWLLEASDSLLKNGSRAGWEVRMFLANHFPEALKSPLDLNMSAKSLLSPEEGEEPENNDSTMAFGKAALLPYVDAVVRSADEDKKLGYLNNLLHNLGDGQDMIGRQFAIYRLIQHLKGKTDTPRLCCTILTLPGSRPSDSPDRFDLAQAHSMLCDCLLQTSTPASFLLAAKSIHLLLDQNPACMTQWNIELTLSTVTAISSQQRPSTQALMSESPSSIYLALCRLVEMVIRRHRIRLDGHFHILLTTLQALLRLLLSQPDAGSQQEQQRQQQQRTIGSGQKQQQRWKERHGKLFARLLTLICEPTAASVTRSQQTKMTAAAGAGTAVGSGPLDSERDRAKRYAGQFMYLVLMQYVRLQLEYVVPHGVREALEPGVYAVLGITTPDVLRIMNDGMDPGGRVLFKEMYKMYQKFGKWSGI
ncbi:Urb2/Npa2 family-domain-containing protein [Corynascus similis CBS 632.67]